MHAGHQVNEANEVIEANEAIEVVPRDVLSQLNPCSQTCATMATDCIHTHMGIWTHGQMNNDALTHARV